jgi:hypothetical protein
MESRLCVGRQCLLLLHDLMIAFLHDMNAVVIRRCKSKETRQWPNERTNNDLHNTT